MTQYPELESSLADSCIGEVDEATGLALLEGMGIGNVSVGILPPPVPDRRSPPTNRYSYRQAIYSRNVLNGDADIG